MNWAPRPALPADLAPLAALWHRVWHEAHAAIVPPELTALRTPESFAARLSDMGDRLRVAGPEAAPRGLCIIKGNRIDQLYIAAEARGTELAARMLQDGEERLAATGLRAAELDCAEKNARAARFYEKNGWQARGIELAEVESTVGPMRIRVIIFDKKLP